jgi:L-lactate dehydrogenase complex protein LldG
MSTQARDEIFLKLKSAQRQEPGARPEAPALAERNFSREQMLERFTAELTALTGAVYQAHDAEDLQRILSEIAAAEGFRQVIAAGENPPGIEIKSLFQSGGVNILTPADFKDREALREAAFQADAGITFADFAVAETGTVGIIFGKDQPRLVSIAPPIHIAIVEVEKLHPVYEDVIAQVFGNADAIPGQFAFITGPSTSSDIQAINFKGMHGPTKVIVIFIMGK